MENSIKYTQVSYIFMAIYLVGILFGKGIRYVFPSLDTVSPDILEFAIMVIIAQVGIYFLPSLGFVVYKGQSIKKTFKLNGISSKQLGWSILLLILVQGILNFVHFITELFAYIVGYSYQMNFYPIADNWISLIVLIICIGIIPPVCEDLFFRGFLLSGSSQYGGHFAVLFSAFTFALFHDNLYRFGEIFIYALFVGYVVYYTDSILPGIVIHVLTNTSYVVGSYFMSGDFVTSVSVNESITIGEFIWFKFLAFTLLGAVALLLSLKIMKKIKELSPVSVISFEQKNKSNISLYRFFNIPNLISITVFVLRIFTDF